jgi:hypothetical protein
MKQTITATVNAILIALALVGLNADQAIAQGKARKGVKVRAGSDVRIAKTSGAAKPTAATSELQNAENLRSSVRRKNTAGSEGFSIDIGTSENIRLETEGARRKATKRARQQNFPSLTEPNVK